ncbi:MAG TPA: tRNA pseudouridine(55) synthase TruB [Thermoleophilaceae bacterium]|jgi:tRNA pseudouridine55 synthase|nr:tRNA pseudouridine(55) synthase TruB [Thermoleophilaceae bacterium]
MALSGVLLYPKPAGVTSHDVVARVRRHLGEETGRRVKVGHAGTLDPFATGVLLVLVGGATRAQRFLMALPKTYRAVARLGWTSDTGDRDGSLEQTGRMPESLAIPTGELMQAPPAYSAVKVGGERLYKKARRGEFVQADARPVTIYRAELLRHEGDEAAFEIECSSGTYIRSLITDLGDAYCEELERTAIGPFRIEDASEERILPLDEALDFLPERELDSDEATKAANGVALRTENWELGTEHVRLMHEQRLIAIAEPRSNELKPIVVFK